MSPKDILQELVPVNPRPWAAWSACLEKSIQEHSARFMYGSKLKEMLQDEGEEKCLKDLIDDAQAAYDQYVEDHHCP